MLHQFPSDGDNPESTLKLARSPQIRPQVVFLITRLTRNAAADENKTLSTTDFFQKNMNGAMTPLHGRRQREAG